MTITTSQDPYRQLEARFHRLSVLGDVAAVLNWDNAVIMPDGGSGARAEQLALLKIMRHEQLADAAMADLLSQAEADSDALDAWQRANLREMRWRWRHATAVSVGLTEALSKAASTAEMAWRQARADDHFATVKPHLEAVLVLVRESAAGKADALNCTPYDALLDGYDSGMRVADFADIFRLLKTFLPDFLDDIVAREQGHLAAPLPARLPLQQQENLARRFMGYLGFNFTHGRLDTSHHPFTGGVREDIRLTTRYDREDFVSGLMGVLHETGHALYEQGLPEAWRHQPVGGSMGMSLHESQSLIIEMQACRSDAFFALLSRVLPEFTGSGQIDAEGLARRYRRVQRSLIRVDADEVSYPLHVILRFELEQAMVAGDLSVADLPGAWREGMTNLLGVTPQDDRDGCLQDIHWYGGDFGYFPTYTLGAIGAAQLFEGAAAACPGLHDAIAEGDFAPLTGWLRTHVHSQGRRHGSANDLLRQTTGRPLDVDTFKQHLIDRYGS